MPVQEILVAFVFLEVLKFREITSGGYHHKHLDGSLLYIETKNITNENTWLTFQLLVTTNIFPRLRYYHYYFQGLDKAPLLVTTHIWFGTSL